MYKWKTKKVGDLGEIKTGKTLSYDEYNQLEKDAEAIKQFIECRYKEQRLVNLKEIEENDL